ncbi:uncharacterized protein SRCM101294_02027 [Bacillus amyloliquefaciens]|uniref:YueH family protein n=1 Tax=Bacillus amyloliquefaciens TaxID=1390 RepID=UPI00080C74B4|nr:YueH family protein [Bacillus amyloliquefaciens]MEC3840181.1 YueH family protein [Bacillus amyloliquefaciens]OCB94970.1 uncharacterized protein SRCM101294_02027 [Bacillus amyloliquefaciens]
MKIRKANITVKSGMIGDVYLHENKKEQHTLVAVPELEWSTIISYEEEKKALAQRLLQSFSKLIEEEPAGELAGKISHWVAEM